MNAARLIEAIEAAVDYGDGFRRAYVESVDVTKNPAS